MKIYKRDSEKDPYNHPDFGAMFRRCGRVKQPCAGITYSIPAEQGWVRSTLPGMLEATDVSGDVQRSSKQIQSVIIYVCSLPRCSYANFDGLVLRRILEDSNEINAFQ